MTRFLLLATAILALWKNAEAQCVDKVDKNLCSSWKNAGYCQHSYVPYMKANCEATCLFCIPVPPTVDPYPNCKDKSTYCSSYINYCKDPGYIAYLQNNCKKSCNYCHLTTRPPPTTLPTTAYTVPGGAKSLQPGCGRKGSSHTRIVGGTMAKPGDWPWMVTFDYKKNYINPGHHCGGALISDEWILSAAHCFYSDQDASQYSLILGEHDLGSNSGYEQKLPIAEIRLHPKYDHSIFDYDLALVKLARKATINDRVKTTCLPDHNTTFPLGTKCYVTGWGRLSHGGIAPKILRQAQVPLISRQTCQNANQYHKVTGNMLCAGYAEGGIDSCQGDSGGPLVCKTQDDTWFLWGAVSWGAGCGAANKYGVYANTKALRPWVDSVVFASNQS
eukprot:gene20512-22530_t